tara:strand:- start:1125 stop:1472 length:348 start_codon:yes stop_codon:yes gene_type:complete
MPKSRYIGTQIIRPALAPGVIERNRLEKEGVSTFASYPPELFENEVVLYHTLQAGDRLDYLARKYFSNGRYWWMICMVNGIIDPIADKKLKPGTILKMVVDPNRVIQIMNSYRQK